MRAKNLLWIKGLICIVASLRSTNGDSRTVRCFCNLPECQATGNTCESPLGRCFSQLAHSPAVAADTQHGCIESLPADDMTSCSGDGDIIKTRKYPEGDNKWPVLMCCKSTMCNYFGASVVDVDVVYDGLDDDISGGKLRTTPDYGQSSGLTYDSGEAFFRVVVVLIPIATIFILSGLIFVAVRWMKDDNRRRRHQVLRDEALARVKLYVEDHFEKPHCYVADEYQVKDKRNDLAQQPSVHKSTAHAHNCTSRVQSAPLLNQSVFPLHTCDHTEAANHARNSPSHTSLAKKNTCKKTHDSSRQDKMASASKSPKCDSVFLLASTDDGTDASIV